jgi:hypothetical protein
MFFNQYRVTGIFRSSGALFKDSHSIYKYFAPPGLKRRNVPSQRLRKNLRPLFLTAQPLIKEHAGVAEEGRSLLC